MCQALENALHRAEARPDLGSSCARFEVCEDLFRGVAAWCPEDCAPGPGACSAEVEVLYGSAIAGVAGDGAALEHLLGQDLAVEDVAARYPDARFYIRWTEHLDPFDGSGQVGCVLSERLDDVVPDLLSPLRPCPLRQLVRRVLAEQAQRVLARRGEPFFGSALDVAVDEGSRGGLAPLALLPRLLQRVYRRVYDDAARVLGPDLFARQGRKIRQLTEGQKHFHHRALRAHRLDPLDQVDWQMLLADHAEVGALRVGVGEDHLGFQGTSVEEVDARCSTVLDLYLGDLGVGEDLGTRLAGRGGYRL